MKKYLVLFICLVLFSFSAENVFAHVLLSDGPIGVFLHIDPEDNPIAGQQTNFFLEFTDKENKFKPADCECIFSILKAGKEIYSTKLFRNNTDTRLTASTSFTFPRRDVYTIKITGKPITSNEFQAFTMTETESVDRGPTSTSNSSRARAFQNNLLLFSSIIVLLGAGYLLWRQLQK